MMFTRTLSIAGVLAGIGSALTFLRSQGIMTTQTLLWILIIVGCALAELLTSWGYTQFYKMDTVPLTATLSTADKYRWKQRIYKRAVFSAFVIGSIEGVVLILSTVDMRHMAVYAVLWLLGVTLIALSSPFVWKVVFEMLLPWMLRRDPGLGVEIRRDPMTGQVDSIKDHTQPDAKTEVIGRPRGGDQ